MNHRRQTQTPRVTFAAACGMVLVGVAATSAAVLAEESPAFDRAVASVAASRSRETDVAVVLARNCLECHNTSDRKGGLDLTRREQALAGGDSGQVLKPGDPENSLLVQRIDVGEMPPKGRDKLSANDRKLLRDWVKDGAIWAADPIDPFLYTSTRRAGYNWWSLQPLRVVEPPSIARRGTRESSDALPTTDGSLTTSATRPGNQIDDFILHRLERAGLKPSPEADRRRLIRRLSFDLIGLPPAPEEVEEFINDPDPRAYEHVVNRLLASPHYGERWARHWLDIVRFGESQGFERNKLRPSLWKYRDFVVEALNADLPYDDFMRWQIAGDVLRPDDPLAVVASGFLALGPYDLTAYNNGTPDMRAFAREEELEGLVGTVSQTFLGLTVNCSRCHDHKFDPITQREFYQISAALGGTYQGGERESLTDAARPAIEKRIAELQTEIEKLRSRHVPRDEPNGRTTANQDADSDQKATSNERSAHHTERDGYAATQGRDLAARRSRLESVMELLKGGPVHTTVPKQPSAWHVLARGDFKQPGEIVAPRGIASVTGASPDWNLAENAPEADRRKALAEWIAHPSNPLTPRVIVNRLWGYHFGEGLVRTPSDFGFQGGLPSHPELLDWLAGQLIRPSDGPAWSLKRIQRLIVTSATYRQVSAGRRQETGSRGQETARTSQSVDADNRWLWHRPRHRLEAETFRDAVLAVSGDLDLKLGGPGYRDFKISSAGDNETYTVFDAIGSEFNRRSLYRTWVRAGTSPLLDTLDCPDPSVPTPRRSVTSTPLQALSLLNDVFIEHYAARFAERLRREAGDDATAQARRTYALAFARKPTPEEAAFGQQFIAEHGLAQFCVVVFNANEFLFVE